MAHVGEETVLCFVEHLDLAVLFCGGNELFVETVLGVEHRNTHCDLEYSEYREINEADCVAFQSEGRGRVQQEYHSCIGYECDDYVFEGVKINAQRNDK